MKQGLKNLTAGTLMLLFATTATNGNAYGQNIGPGNFTPKAPAAYVAATDSAPKTGGDTLDVNFKTKATGEDSTKKSGIDPNMPLDDQARIYSRNNDAIGFAIFKGKDMAKYTDEQMIEFYSGIFRDSGVAAKIFIGPGYAPDGYTVYSAFVNGGSVGGIMNGNNVLGKDGLPEAIMTQKGFDNRRRRASLSPQQRP